MNTYIHRSLKPSHNFICGLILMICFFATRSLLFRVIEMFFFLVLALAAGKRIRFLYFFFLSLSILFAHLLIPSGRLLFSLGPLLITESSLLLGLQKLVFYLSVVWASLFTVRSDLPLPGHLGQMIALTFQVYEILSGSKRGKKKIFESLSQDLKKSYFANPSLKISSSVSSRGAIILCFFVIALFCALLIADRWPKS